MTDQARTNRARALDLARLGFVLITIAFAWWGFQGRWGEIGAAMAQIGLLRLALALLGAVCGLALTGLLWQRLLAALGSPVRTADAARVFFVGQLGKYVPGSVWTFAAQAQLGRRHEVPARSSVSASALFLLVHVFSAVLLGGLLAALGFLDTDLWVGWWWLAVFAAIVALAPATLRTLGARIAGKGVAPQLTGSNVVGAVAAMGLVWVAYGFSLWWLLPDLELSLASAAGVVAAFALAHAAGVLLIVAPAGLGAREGVLIALLVPMVGVPSAAAAALLARLVHALADFLIAGAAAAWARSAR